jgi:hypothetical protein
MPTHAIQRRFVRTCQRLVHRRQAPPIANHQVTNPGTSEVIGQREHAQPMQVARSHHAKMSMPTLIYRWT